MITLNKVRTHGSESCAERRSLLRSGPRDSVTERRCLSFELFLRHQRIRNPSLRTRTEYISSFMYESGLCRYVDNSYHVPQLLSLLLNSRHTDREKFRNFDSTLYVYGGLFDDIVPNKPTEDIRSETDQQASNFPPLL